MFLSIEWLIGNLISADRSPAQGQHRYPPVNPRTQGRLRPHSSTALRSVSPLRRAGPRVLPDTRGRPCGMAGCFRRLNQRIKLSPFAARHRVFVRSIRTLRGLRRYSPSVVVQSAGQVNVAEHQNVFGARIGIVRRADRPQRFAVAWQSP